VRIAFLYNHDAPHQVTHTAPIIPELLALDSVVEVSILTTSDEQERPIREIIGSAADKVEFTRLRAGPMATGLDRFARHVAPFKRLAVLKHNLQRLAAFDAIVVPETTTALLRTRFGVQGPKLIYLPHGAGDRSVGFQDVIRAFDLVLVSGTKVQDRMLAEGLIREGGYAVVGYPKFDTIDLEARVRLFQDDKPVVLYNPHFDPLLSSWYDHGIGILDWFAGQRGYNLVFAPHVMLFRRRIHASTEHRRVRVRRDLPKRFLDASNILIDTGSSRSVDMTYTRSCDIYLGDASSQIYEWLARPRPAIFFNSHGARWQNDPNYTHWQLGQVIDRAALLSGALDRADQAQPAFAERQAAAFARTFSLAPEPAARRAAAAILSFLRSAQTPIS
jgi:hypothetical protein